jgi:hypothetical protein
MKTVQYFVDKDPDGNIDGLIRIVREENVGMWGEEYYDGKWHRVNNGAAFRQDSGYGDFICDHEEAKKI